MDKLKYIPQIIAYCSFIIIIYITWFSGTENHLLTQHPLFIAGWALFIIGLLGNVMFFKDQNENPTIGTKIAPIGFAVSVVGMFLNTENILSIILIIFGFTIFIIGVYVAIKNGELQKNT